MTLTCTGELSVSGGEGGGLTQGFNDVEAVPMALKTRRLPEK